MDYGSWSENVSTLYDMAVTKTLEWPSLTVHWFPEKTILEDQFSVQRLLIGTHTAPNVPNSLIIAELKTPYHDLETRDLTAEISIKKRMTHNGEINRARVCPYNDHLIATKTVLGPVCIFDHTKLPAFPVDNEVRPTLILTGHTLEGYGLSWNPNQEGLIVSGGEDKLICAWDITHQREGSRVGPSRIYMGHDDVVEDVAWNPHHRNLFGSVGDDRKIITWDHRQADPTNIMHSHFDAINCISYNPSIDWLFATGSADNSIFLWDSRYLDANILSLQAHTNQIYQVEWSPFHDSVLGSCSSDGRVMVWDISRSESNQTEIHSKEAPPELIFIHGGHSSKVSDFNWNPNENWVIATVGEDNLLQTWQVADACYADL